MSSSPRMSRTNAAAVTRAGRDIPPVPTPVQHGPRDKPDDDGAGGDAGERTGGFVEIHQALDRRQTCRPGWRRRRRETSRCRPRARRLRRRRWDGTRVCWQTWSDETLCAHGCSPSHDVDRCAALDGRVLVEHGAKESGDAGGEERDPDKAENRGAQLGMDLEIAAISREDRRSHGDGDGHEPGDMLLPLHADGVPGAGGGTRHQQRCGNAARSVAPGGGAARYQG